MHNTDITLLCDTAIICVANGDRDALGVIYDCMARNIYFAAYAITLNHADAEDALQDTMLQIVKYAPSYHTGTNARAWILTIARHRALDIVRRRKATVSMDDVTLAEIPVCEEGEDAPNVLILLNSLNEQERQLVVFKLYEELTYGEIAQIMKISVFAAQKRYQRALKKLKSLFEERSCTDERKANKRNIPSA